MATSTRLPVQQRHSHFPSRRLAHPRPLAYGATGAPTLTTPPEIFTFDTTSSSPGAGVQPHYSRHNHVNHVSGLPATARPVDCVPTTSWLQIAPSTCPIPQPPYTSSPALLPDGPPVPTRLGASSHPCALDHQQIRCLAPPPPLLPPCSCRWLSQRPAHVARLDYLHHLWSTISLLFWSWLLEAYPPRSKLKHAGFCHVHYSYAASSTQLESSPFPAPLSVIANL